MNNRNSSHKEMILQIAKMYYMENMTQEEISKAVYISRANISRLLKTSRKLGIVEIRINDTSPVEAQLQQQLKREFGLKDVIVIKSDQESTANKIRLGVAASNYLESILVEGMLLGISWGTSLYHLVQSFRPVKPPKVDLVQLLGGTGARDLDTDGMELGKKLAEILGGRCYILQAPLIVQNKQTRDLILSEYDIEQTLRKAAQTDIAIVGIGSNHPDDSALVRSGYLTREESEDLLTRGIVGDICGRQIDVNGMESTCELNSRTVGIGLEMLRNIPTVVGVAAGENKAQAILSALRGNYINVLITDSSAALAVMNMIRTI